MNISRVKDGNFWNNFIQKQEFVNILSSWEWIEYEKELGFHTSAYSFGHKGVFAFRVVNAKKGKYLILKQNTFLDWKDEDMVFSLIEFLKKKCKEKGCNFFRIFPPLLLSDENQEVFQKYNFKKSAINFSEGQFSTVINLEKTLEEILNDMRKNTRYLIRKGGKMGIEVVNTGGDEYLNDFKKLYEKTIERQGWKAKKFNDIKKQYKFFSSRGFSRMFVVKYKGEILGMSIFTKFHNEVIYHHSASIADRNIPAMYILIWEAIKYYKEDGLKEFNFFGICEKNDVKHPWYGLSLFKRGFGGKERKLMFSYDYPVNTFYFLTRFIEYIMNFKN